MLFRIWPTNTNSEQFLVFFNLKNSEKTDYSRTAKNCPLRNFFLNLPDNLIRGVFIVQQNFKSNF